MYLCRRGIRMLRECDGKCMRTSLKLLLLLTTALLLTGCQQSTGDVGETCRNREECKEGLKCGDNTCYDPSRVTIKNAIGSSRPLSGESSKTCLKSRACKDYGRCSPSVAGGCVPSLPSHCEQAAIGCKQKDRCTFVPDQNECCTDATGKNCNPKLGDRVLFKKKSPEEKSEK